MSCVTLANSIRPACAAIKRPGGLDKRVFIGLVSDLASVTFGTNNSVDAITFNEGAGLVEYIGKKEKNNADESLEVGENVNLRNQAVNLVVYAATDAHLAHLDSLLDTEGIFVIVEHNGGDLEVYGLNKGANFNNFGLTATALTRNTGTLLNDNNAYNLTLSGRHTNLHLLYAPATDLDTNITALEALVIDPVV